MYYVKTPQFKNTKMCFEIFRVRCSQADWLANTNEANTHVCNLSLDKERGNAQYLNGVRTIYFMNWCLGAGNFYFSIICIIAQFTMLTRQVK